MNKKLFFIFMIVVATILLGACNSSNAGTTDENLEETTDSSEREKEETTEESITIPSNYDLETLIDAARKETFTQLCASNNGEVSLDDVSGKLTTYYSEQYISTYYNDFYQGNSDSYCSNELPEEKPTRMDAQVKDFTDKQITFAFTEKEEQNGEVSFISYEYTLVKQANGWVIDQIQKGEEDVAATKQINDRLNSQFFNGNYDYATDEIKLINFLGKSTPQVLTIQEENSHSVVRVFDYVETDRSWQVIYEDNEHDSFDGMESLQVYGSAPLADDANREQVIIGLQTGSAAVLSFYILGADENNVNKIFDLMDEPLTASSVAIDGKDIVITSYLEDDTEYEYARFKIDKAGLITYGDYRFGFPAVATNTLTYDNKEYAFTIELPSSFKDQYVVRETNPDWFVAYPSNPPVSMYAFGFVHDGKFIQDCFWLAVFENVDEAEFTSFYENGGGFEKLLAVKDGKALVAIFPSQLEERLYEEPYLELANQLSTMVMDAQTQISESVSIH